MVTPTESGQAGDNNDLGLSNGRESPVPVTPDRGELANRPPVRDEMVELLATYFSGSNVAAASIGLELGGHARLMAQPFFALREALGVTGYASRDEIAATIKAVLTASQVEAGEVELRQKLRMIISHASGGHLSEPDDVNRPTNDICVEISRHNNRIWEHAQESALARKEQP